MSNATRWYTTREAVKAAVKINGATLDALIDSYIESASEDIERNLGRRFIPYVATKYFYWPQRTQVQYLRWPQTGDITSYYILKLDEDLLSVSALTKDDTDLTAIDSSKFFLEPSNIGPPYQRIELDISTDAFFSYQNTPQRSIRVTGSWGFSNATKVAGALAVAVSDTTGTSINVTDASLVGVGDTLLIDSEQAFVSGRSALTTTATLSGNPTAAVNDVTIGVSNGALVKVGEVILVDSERMYVHDVAGNNLSVDRAYDGSVLAAHSLGATVYAYRTLTVVRGINGTTAATHLSAAAVSKYAPPADIADLCRAEAIAHHEQGRGGWTGVMGGDQPIESRMFNLQKMRDESEEKYRRMVLA